MIKTVLGNHSVISHADDRPRRLVERPACCNQGDGRCKVLRKSSTHFGTTTSPLQMDGYTRKPIDCLFDYHVAQGKSLFQAERRLETVTRRVSEGQSTLARSLAHAGYQKPMPDEKNAFSCRPDQGRDTCRNSANASSVAEITLSTTFLLASAVPAIAAFTRSGLLKKQNFKTHASGYQNAGTQADALT